MLQAEPDKDEVPLLEDLGAIWGYCPVEKALKAFADENIAVELEDFAVSGRNRIMILGVDQK